MAGIEENEKLEFTEDSLESDVIAQMQADEAAAEAAEAAEKEEPEADSEAAALREELAQVKDSQLRLMAEYDNFKKRTAREKEAILFDATLICMNKILPVLDNLIRAQAAPCSDEAYKGGVDMVLKSFDEALERMGVSIIEAQDAQFDPNYHNAVMHVEGDEYPENTVIEVFQNGYKMGDRVIRPAMVKVAN